jgi:hypothetical protein
MGYEVHITRARRWTESETNPIRFEEWLAVVASDPELQKDDVNGPHDFLWLAADGPRPLWWRRGKVYTKNPDRLTILKMLDIAARLGARVQGDEGESYPTLGHWPDGGVYE